MKTYVLIFLCAFIVSYSPVSYTNENGFFVGANWIRLQTGARFGTPSQRYEYETDNLGSLQVNLGYYLNKNIRIGFSSLNNSLKTTEVDNKLFIETKRLFFDYIIHNKNQSDLYLGVAYTHSGWKLSEDSSHSYDLDTENGMAIRLGLIHKINNHWNLSFNYTYDSTIADVAAYPKNNNESGYMYFGAFYPIEIFSLGIEYGF
jgi:hypothetical protein